MFPPQELLQRTHHDALFAAIRFMDPTTPLAECVEHLGHRLQRGRGIEGPAMHQLVQIICGKQTANDLYTSFTINKHGHISYSDDDLFWYELYHFVCRALLHIPNNWESSRGQVLTSVESAFTNMVCSVPELALLSPLDLNGSQFRMIHKDSVREVVTRATLCVSSLLLWTKWVPWHAIETLIRIKPSIEFEDFAHMHAYPVNVRAAVLKHSEQLLYLGETTLQMFFGKGDGQHSWKRFFTNCDKGNLIHEFDPIESYHVNQIGPALDRIEAARTLLKLGHGTEAVKVHKHSFSEWFGDLAKTLGSTSSVSGHSLVHGRTLANVFSTRHQHVGSHEGLALEPVSLTRVFLWAAYTAIEQSGHSGHLFFTDREETCLRQHILAFAPGRMGVSPLHDVGREQPLDQHILGDICRCLLIFSISIPLLGLTKQVETLVQGSLGHLNWDFDAAYNLINLEEFMAKLDVHLNHSATSGHSSENEHSNLHMTLSMTPRQLKRYQNLDRSRVAVVGWS
ncbi:hypothetical protein ACM66B_003188 [Microbotryomycetes sp. NB124-2]